MAKPKGYWTKSKCIEEIKRLGEEGFDLSPGNTCKYQGSLYTKSLQLIGSWKEAIELAGLDYSSIRKKKQNGYWTKDKIIKEVKNLYKQDEDLSPTSITKINNGLYQCAIKVFGSWKNTLEFCNIDYSQIKRKKENNYWTKEVIESEILMLLNEGVKLNTSSIETTNYGMYRGAIRAYGSWENALTVLGIDYSQVRLDEDFQRYFGQRFERIVYDILDELGVKYIKNKEISKGLRPDIVFPDKTIFDIKLSNYTDFEGRTTLKKYGKFSNGIGIIFLRGDFEEKEYEINRVAFRHISYYLDQFPIDRSNHYENVLSNLLNKANKSKGA